MRSVTDPALSPAESLKLRRIAGLMIPADVALGVPGADDPVIFDDIVSSLGCDAAAVKAALAGVDMTLDDLHSDRPEILVLGRAVLQCYYRDDRVVRSLGLEPRAPFPLGHVLEQGDWSLLDPVRGRAKMWRDAP